MIILKYIVRIYEYIIVIQFARSLKHSNFIKPFIYIFVLYKRNLISTRQVGIHTKKE